jgi:hypothetical protein
MIALYGAVYTKPSFLRSCTAFQTVGRETRKRYDNSSSDGNRRLTGHSPDCNFVFMAAYMVCTEFMDKKYFIRK